MLNRTLSLALSLVLALALVAGGLARGLAQPGAMTVAAGLTEMVICADGGEGTVLVDGRGNVIDPEKPCLPLQCSQCLQAGAVALASPGYAPEARRPLVRPAHPEPTPVAVAQSVLSANARAPPVVKV